MLNPGNKKFLLKSAIYLCNAKQLVLSEEAMRVITGHWLDSDKQDQELLDVYDEILEKIDRYLPLFDIRDFRNKLHKGREKFLKLNAEDKFKAIIQILKGLHDNSDTGELKDIGITVPFGQLQNNSGITLSSDTILVYQSPTGLFEKRVKISSL
ncbi:Cas9 endonuclease PAM-interacting domain-containing protein [Lactobacillus crispatus]|uniref:Cas9 endonuclease PAM-interacting domain-containing protein n=1 Tax=Lactobacillus crispatus TaxID=47770 RepID=UPI003FA5D085